MDARKLLLFAVLAPQLAAQTPRQLSDDFPVYSPAPAFHGRFGCSVALDGGTLLVGEPGTQTVHVFREVLGGWAPVDVLTDPGSLPGDDYAQSIDLEGDVAVVGAPDAGGIADGRVYVFERRNGTWSGATILHPPSPAPDLAFGWSVDVDGDRIAVGARDQGRAATFVRSGPGWVLEQELVDLPGSWFGDALALQGETLLVGAPRRLTDRGAVVVFELVAGVWQQTDELMASTGDKNDFFGTAIGLDGDTAVIGACGVSDQKVNGGAAWVFQRTAGIWQESERLVIPNLRFWDHVGRRVALEGDVLVLASPPDDIKGKRNVGRLMVYRRIAGSWTFSANLRPAHRQRREYFGDGLSVRGGVVVGGGPQWNGPLLDAGRVIVFRL